MKVNAFYDLYNYNHYFPNYKMHLCVRRTTIIKITFTVRNHVLYISITSILDTGNNNYYHFSHKGDLRT